MIRDSGYIFYPYEVFIPAHGNDLITSLEIDKWCERNWGLEHKSVYLGSWRSAVNGWQFKSYEDAVMLDLAWS